MGKVLIVDGDDTLWENNVYFEEAVEAFIDYLDHSTMTRAQVRAALDDVELMNVARHGYGSAASPRTCASALRTWPSATSVPRTSSTWSAWDGGSRSSR